MTRLEEAKDILQQIGMPKKQQSPLACYSLLALANITPETPWSEATRRWVRIHDILLFAANQYNKTYAENTRENIRKECLHQFRDAALIEDNTTATNCPKYSYSLTAEAVNLLRTYGTEDWNSSLSDWIQLNSTLVELYANQRKMVLMPVNINGQVLHLGIGDHNKLQKAIVEEFAPRFAPGCTCLYLGDTANKDLYKDIDTLTSLGFEITLHDKMPDVVLYRADKDWIYFIEAVTNVGPMSPKRIRELEAMTRDVRSGKIYVTAFLDFAKYRRFAHELAWETEVWIADDPDHMIHLNGDRFMGPR